MPSRLKIVAALQLVLALGVATFPARAPAQQLAQAIAVPEAEVLLVFIRSAMTALDHANKTGNYSVLRELGGPAMQANSSAQLSNLFANLRNNQADLLASLVVTPQLTQAPGISAHGHLHLAGVFPTRPQQIAFQIVYQPINGQWRLFGISVSLQPGETLTTAPGPKAKASAAGLPPDKAPIGEKQTGARPK
jgi:hypothetical protein